MSSHVADRGGKKATGSRGSDDGVTMEPSANKQQLSTRKWKEEKEEKEECQSAAAAAVWRGGASLLTSAPCLVTTEALRDRQTDRQTWIEVANKHTRGFIRLVVKGWGQLAQTRLEADLIGGGGANRGQCQ